MVNFYTGQGLGQDGEPLIVVCTFEPSWCEAYTGSKRRPKYKYLTTSQFKKCLGM